MNQIARASVGFHWLTEVIGTEVTGIDLTAPLDLETAQSLEGQLIERKVLVFRSQRLSNDEFIRFAKTFGTLTPAHPIADAMTDSTELWESRMGPRPESSRVPLTADSLPKWSSHWKPMADYRGWHIDTSFVVNPARYSITRWPECPPHRSDALWANLESAYNGLSSQIQTLVNELQAVHEANATERRRYNRKHDHAFAALHPVVRVHPKSGRLSLFISPTSTSWLLNLKQSESDAIREMLVREVMRPEHTLPFHWEPDMIVVWDNQSTAHTGPIHYPHAFPRVVQHIGIAGERPVGPTGYVSTAIEGFEF